MSLTFDEAKHEYRLGGRPVPGTHRVLGLAGALAGIPDNEEAKRWGALVHRAVELDWKGRLGIGDTVLDEQRAEEAGLMGYVRAARKAVEKEKITVKEVEKLVANRKYQYATKIDAVGTWRKSRAIINWKTGGKMPVYPLQMAGEAMCLRPRPRRLAIYLEANGTYDWEEFKDKRDFMWWRAMLTVADWRLRSTQSIRPRQAKGETEEDVILPVPDSELFAGTQADTGTGGIFSP